jgi:hypothetical protein
MPTMFIYAPAASGKTYLVDQHNNPLIVDADALVQLPHGNWTHEFFLEYALTSYHYWRSHPGCVILGAGDICITKALFGDANFAIWMPAKQVHLSRAQKHFGTGVYPNSVEEFDASRQLIKDWRQLLPNTTFTINPKGIIRKVIPARLRANFYRF